MLLSTEMWELLIDRIQSIENKLDQVNRVRLWKAKITGALIIIYLILLPLLFQYLHIKLPSP